MPSVSDHDDAWTMDNARIPSPTVSSARASTLTPLTTSDPELDATGDHDEPMDVDEDNDSAPVVRPKRVTRSRGRGGTNQFTVMSSDEGPEEASPPKPKKLSIAHIDLIYRRLGEGGQYLCRLCEYVPLSSRSSPVVIDTTLATVGAGRSTLMQR